MIVPGSRFEPVLLLLAPTGCAGSAPVPRGVGAQPGPAVLFVAVEGPCSKLALAPLAGRLMVIHGHKDDTRFAETFTELSSGEARAPLDLLEGLPASEHGYIAEGLDLIGTWPDYFQLNRSRIVVGTPRSAGSSWVDTTVMRYRRGGRDQDESAPAEASFVHEARAAVAPRYCWRELARRELSVSESLAIGQYGPCTTKRAGDPPLLLAAHGVNGEWSASPLPDAARMRTVESVSLALRSPTEAYVAVAGDSNGASAYVARFDGHAWLPIETPFAGEATSVDGSEREGLWVTSRGTLWFKAPGEGWSLVPLPTPALPGAPTAPYRAYRVHVRTPNDVWVEAAPALDAPYRALLRTRRPTSIARCDESAEARRGLR